MNRMVAIFVFAVLFVIIGTQQASADKPANPNCWGVVTSQLAIADGGIGEHASSQDTPRSGLGNVARTILDEPNNHVSDLGSVLAEIDEFPETKCP